MIITADYHTHTNYSHGKGTPEENVLAAIEKGLRRIAISGDGANYCLPCGACRQFLYEFSPDMKVICLNRAREAKRMTLRELMPCGFDSTFL